MRTSHGRPADRGGARGARGDCSATDDRGIRGVMAGRRNQSRSSRAKIAGERMGSRRGMLVDGMRFRRAFLRARHPVKPGLLLLEGFSRNAGMVFRLFGLLLLTARIGHLRHRMLILFRVISHRRLGALFLGKNRLGNRNPMAVAISGKWMRPNRGRHSSFGCTLAGCIIAFRVVISRTPTGPCALGRRRRRGRFVRARSA